LISQFLSADQLQAISSAPGSGDGAPSSADSTEDSIQLLIQLPATYTSSGDGLNTGLNQTLIAAMEPSVKLHISNQWLDMVFDIVPMPDGEAAAACAQAGSTPGNATALIVELTAAIGIAEASVTLACTVRARASADAGRRKLQVRGRTRQDATLQP
jgi:hypothetical protein